MNQMQKLMKKSLDWAKKHPELYESEDEAIVDALRRFIIEYRIE